MVNTGQMLLVIGALLLFTLMLPSLNETMLYNDRTTVGTKVEMTAMALAQRYLAEAGTKAFDEVCLTIQPSLPSQLTTSGSLGRESGETYPNFDDLDDYRNLTMVDTITMPSVRFDLSAAVSYVDPANPTGSTSTQTFLKRVRISITGPYLVNPASEAALQITLEQLFSYY